MNNRLEELLEKKHEFILNESVFADDSPSWLEVAEAQGVAEAKWDATDEGIELKGLEQADTSFDCFPPLVEGDRVRVVLIDLEDPDTAKYLGQDGTVIDDPDYEGPEELIAVGFDDGSKWHFWREEIVKL